MKFRSGADALLYLSLFFSLAACGGEGGGGGGGDETTGSGPVLAGVVYDGPVAGAWVMLLDEDGVVAKECGVSGVGNCVAMTATGEDGSFAISLSSRPLSTGLIARTSGGQDETINFKDIPLYAPLALFAEGEPVVITPVTSLVAARMTNPDASRRETLEQARQSVAGFLNLPKAVLAHHPTSDPRLQQVCSRLGRISYRAVEYGIPDPLRTAGWYLEADSPLIAADDTWDEGLAAFQSTEFAEIMGSVSPANLDSPETFWRTVLADGVKRVADRYFVENGIPFDSTDSNYLENLNVLADTILQAGGGSILPIDHLFPPRVARYLLFVYQLNDFDRFTVDQATFAAGLQIPQAETKLETDPLIAEMARVTAIESVGTPLLDDDLPGNDNLKRLRYFYNSDLSPFYYAEQLMTEIPDITFGDEVMLTTARGKAQAGLIAEAETIINTQIFHDWMQGEGFYALASALISFDRADEAIEALRKAENYFKNYFEINNYAVSSSEAFRLVWVASAYRRAGDPDASLAVFQYILENLTTASTYSAVIVGIWKVADDYIDAGQPEEALPLIDFMYRLASVPPDLVAEKQQVYFLIETAKRYANLGKYPTVEAIYREVQTIRADPLVASATWVYMHYMVEVLYRSGFAAEAYALAATIPPGTNKIKAFKLVATYEALNSTLAQAVAIVETNLAKAEDRLDAMTYYASNDQSPYIALSLIQRQRFSEARQALDQALLYLPAQTVLTDFDRHQKLVQRGYVKIADLFARAGDRARAESLLGMAEGVLASIGTLKYRVEAMADIGYGYHLLGQPVRGMALLQQAADEIAAARFARLLSYTDFDYAGMYKRLINTALEAGFKSLARDLVDSFTDTAAMVFDAARSYTGDAHDLQAVDEIDLLLQAADFLVLLADPQAATATVAEAEAVVGQIWVEATRIEKMIAKEDFCIISGYAAAGQFETALGRARALAYAPDRYLALQTIAAVFAHRDDFPETETASIDSDHDGAPDFFHPLATAEEIAGSGLILDSDTDNDGFLDTVDRRPWVADFFSW